MSPTARIHYENRAQIESKGRCWIGSFSIVVAGGSKASISPPLLVLGDNVYIGDQVNLRAAGGKIYIGSDVLIANHVTVVAANHGMRPDQPMILQDWERGDVTIEDDVWIGAGAIVLPGTAVRRGAIIAAGAVVRGEIPRNTIYGGVPARQIGIRE